MIEQIEFRDKYGDLSAKIEIFGSSNKVTIKLDRYNSKMIITKNYGVFEFISHLFILSNTPWKFDKQQWFENRIHDAIKLYSIIAKQYVEKDEEQMRCILEAKKQKRKKLLN
jgi:hypothetical protein